MTLSELKRSFLTELTKEYPCEEANSFFGLLTEAYLEMSRLQVALQRDKEISEADLSKFKSAKQRLLEHEPIQHILGETEFFGLKFKVSKDVLVPRPETEELVQWILDDLDSENKQLRLLDIGTGSGCIAISLAKNLPEAEIFAMDISAEALETARLNAANNKVVINLAETDVLKLEKLEQNFNIIVSNPPYVRELEKTDMQPNVIDYEPETALYVKDDDPLIFYRKITGLAQKALVPGGKLYFEINQYLGPETEKLLQEYGFKTELRKDIYGNFRMLKGIK
ncbi:MAG: peptide chain release factor N(5)-glutamine methyltransferase [Salegentibacter sp.]|uniref:peptide chain release factor N(5)-glutamine methyltransferase n=1 Tax=Salegentibacter sp. TaxID=1903072 RepID=UPI00287016E0|nr:peptide chain release factor N(5)-glutamine methyltransferase [Salegentibacter sp.]MDR9457913.1 peptide chain release factor N(5)-glutamine methyltransferase [Salegentibacter sp.]